MHLIWCNNVNFRLYKSWAYNQTKKAFQNNLNISSEQITFLIYPLF